MIVDQNDLEKQLTDSKKTIKELRAMLDQSAQWRSRNLWKESCEQAEKQNVLLMALVKWLRNRVPGVTDEIQRMYGVLDVPFLTEDEKRKYDLLGLILRQE